MASNETLFSWLSPRGHTHDHAAQGIETRRGALSLYLRAEVKVTEQLGKEEAHPRKDESRSKAGSPENQLINFPGFAQPSNCESMGSDNKGLNRNQQLERRQD